MLQMLKKKEDRLKALEDALLRSQTPLAIENGPTGPAAPAGQLAIGNGQPAAPAAPAGQLDI